MKQAEACPVCGSTRRGHADPGAPSVFDCGEAVEENAALTCKMARMAAIKARHRVKELEGQHKGLVLVNAFLRQRPDLPVDRIPAAAAAQKRIDALTDAMRGLLDVIDLRGGHGIPVIRDRANAYIAIDDANKAIKS